MLQIYIPFHKHNLHVYCEQWPITALSRFAGFANISPHLYGWNAALGHEPLTSPPGYSGCVYGLHLVHEDLGATKELVPVRLQLGNNTDVDPAELSFSSRKSCEIPAVFPP